jgi:phage recombination protein Bet
MNPTTNQVQKAEKPMEFVPFGGTAKIMLSIKIVRSLLCKPTKSGRLCSENDALRFMMLCQAKGLNPFEGDAFLVGYDSRQPDGTYLAEFSQIVAHQAFLKRAERNSEYDGMKSGVIVKNEDGSITEQEGDFRSDSQSLLGGWALVFFKNRKVPRLEKLRFSSRAKYNRTGELTEFWKRDPEGQIVKCAEAAALRSSFPTLLGGLFTSEEGGRLPDVQTDGATLLSMNLPDPAPSQEPIPAEIVPTDDDGVDLGSQAPKGGASAAPESTPERGQQPAQKSNPAAGSAKDELQQLVLGAGFTFDHFKLWGEQSGNVPGASSMADFSEIKETDAKRLVRAKTGLLQGLSLVK